MFSTQVITPRDTKPSLALSLVLLLASVTVMLVLRFVLFPDRFITLSYNIPLLLCLWHRDARLLWSMAVAFVGMSAYKAFFWVPDPVPGDNFESLQWFFQLCNIAACAIAVQLTITLSNRLRGKNAELEHANSELRARAAEITQQNEELQTQSEELGQQNEEIHSQAEELERQNEELGHQAEELRTAQEHASQRASMLQTLLASVHDSDDPDELLRGVCEAALKLLDGHASAVAILDKKDDTVCVRARHGFTKLTRERWPYASSFAAVIMEQEKTGFIADLAHRPDLVVATPADKPFSSILGTPLIVAGQTVGVVEAFSLEPRKWNADHFAVLEWVAKQAGLILEARASRRQLEDIISERTRQLQEMITELQHFSYTITHDMRAPLRSLQGFAALLRNPAEQLTEEERADFLSRIVTSAGRMDQLITDALSYSQAVQQQIPLAPVDTANLLSGILQSYPSLQPPQAEIKVEGRLPVVLANEAGLTQCFANLLTNAVKFVAPGCQPRVRVYADINGSHARIWIEDNGIGIPEQMRPKLFHMFQRANREYEGTGIGLALVRKVSERMGGSVGFSSESGKGTRFWLEFQLPDQSRIAKTSPPQAFATLGDQN